jgi:hypothetical protein
MCTYCCGVVKFCEKDSRSFLMDVKEIAFIIFVVYLKMLTLGQNTRCQMRG